MELKIGVTTTNLIKDFGKKVFLKFKDKKMFKNRKQEKEEKKRKKYDAPIAWLNSQKCKKI